MYFWNVNKLVEDLRLNKVSEVDFKNYYIASTIIIFFGYLALTLTPESSASEAWASFILQVGLLMSWMNAIFKVNGGEKGRDFLKRIIALYLPITFQSFALFVVIGVVLNAILPFFSSNLDEAAFQQFNIIKDLIFEVILSTYIYWRIYKAVKQINHPK